MAQLNFKTFYFTKDNADTSENPYRYDVIALPNGDRIIKVFGILVFTNDRPTAQLYEFYVNQEDWRAQYSIGTNTQVRISPPPTFESYVLDKCQAHRNQVF